MTGLQRIAIAGILMLVSVAEVLATGTDDIEKHRSCNQCGMDRKAYGYSRMLITYEDGTEAGVCSLHCAAAEMAANPGRTLKIIQAADRNSRLLIDAKSAVWIMGGRKRGVMTQVPKWAFSSKADADAFIKANDGKTVSWEDALASAQGEFSAAH